VQIDNKNIFPLLYNSIIASGQYRVKREEVRLHAPVSGMDKVICVGMNYRDHCEEQGAPVPVEPVIFNKFPSCIVGPYDDIIYPSTTKVKIKDLFTFF